jgi:hypothetical protein
MNEAPWHNEVHNQANPYATRRPPTPIIECVLPRIDNIWNTSPPHNQPSLGQFHPTDEFMHLHLTAAKSTPFAASDSIIRPLTLLLRPMAPVFANSLNRNKFDANAVLLRTFSLGEVLFAKQNKANAIGIWFAFTSAGVTGRNGGFSLIATPNSPLSIGTRHTHLRLFCIRNSQPSHYSAFFPLKPRHAPYNGA